MIREWERATRQHPCAICEKPDWCTKGETGWCCMRVESTITLKNGGWFHPFDRDRRTNRPRPQLSAPAARGPAPDFTRVMAEYRQSTNGQVGRLAYDLGVSERSLKALGTAYSPHQRAFAFPMADSGGAVIGIRLRTDDGKKFAVKGSKQGLFLPDLEVAALDPRTVLICEGPSDTAAALTLGLYAIGRPACLGCEEMVAVALAILGARDVIVCYDNDGPGARGADKLIANLKGFRVRRFVPPTKDLRNFLHLGGSMELLLSMTSNSIRT